MSFEQLQNIDDRKFITEARPKESTVQRKREENTDSSPPSEDWCYGGRKPENRALSNSRPSSCLNKHRMPRLERFKKSNMPLAKKEYNPLPQLTLTPQTNTNSPYLEPSPRYGANPMTY